MRIVKNDSNLKMSFFLFYVTISSFFGNTYHSKMCACFSYFPYLTLYSFCFVLKCKHYQCLPTLCSMKSIKKSKCLINNVIKHLDLSEILHGLVLLICQARKNLT